MKKNTGNKVNYKTESNRQPQAKSIIRVEIIGKHTMTGDTHRHTCPLNWFRNDLLQMSNYEIIRVGRI